jgi:hypothetical protein
VFGAQEGTQIRSELLLCQKALLPHRQHRQHVLEARFVENIHELIFLTQIFWNIKEFKIENHDENILIT